MNFSVIVPELCQNNDFCKQAVCEYFINEFDVSSRYRDIEVVLKNDKNEVLCRAKCAIVNQPTILNYLKKEAIKHSVDFVNFLQRITEDNKLTNRCEFNCRFMFISLIQVNRKFKKKGFGSQVIRYLIDLAFSKEDLDYIAFAAVPTSYYEEEDKEDFSMAELASLWLFYKEKFGANHFFSNNDFYLHIKNIKKTNVLQ